MQDKLPIAIVSDIVCPWCFIGKARLETALAQHGLTDRVAITWLPYELNPDMPPEGMDRTAYLDAKFGGRARAATVYGRIEAAAREAGLEVDFGRIARVPNTLDAHRLIHWAGIEGVQTPVVSALFAAYFRDGRDIGDASELARIAAACGMDGAAVAVALQGEADRDDLAARDADARARGVTAVPTWLIDRRHVLQGAQPPVLWLGVIDEILAKVGVAGA